MRSLILTVLYLAKDTVHRWFSRVSSPLARVLVVFFLSLCALAALGSYAISVKIVRDRITRQGGDLVFVNMSAEPGVASAVPTEKEFSDLLDCDSYALRTIGSATGERRLQYPIYTYDFRRSSQFLPLMAPGGGPTCLVEDKADSPSPGPSSATASRVEFNMFVRRLPEHHMLLQLMGGRGILVQPDTQAPFLNAERVSVQRILLRIRHLEDSSSIRRVERYMQDFMRLEGWNGNIVSASRLLAELDGVLGKQVQCRIAFCIGISCIVGILLTALAGMEYRQNEYIYTLMKSFGIHPVMLVGAFVVENTIIVGGSFAAALATFMHFQKYVVESVLKLGHYSLSLQEIMPEVRIITFTLAACVLVSSLPIVAAANRAIGRVLK